MPCPAYGVPGPVLVFRGMSYKRRLLMTGAALLPILALNLARLNGWTVAAWPGTARHHTGVDSQALALAVTALVAGAAVYLGAGGLDPRRGAVAALVLGWGGCVLATGAGELALHGTGASYGWFAYAPYEAVSSSPPGGPAAGGVALGWIAGLAVLAAYRLTRRDA